MTHIDPEIIDDSQTPKYEQIIKLIISDIQAGFYKLGERLPSINETSEEYLIARDTVEKAYKRLREKGIVKSVPGKGYYVCNTDFSNVFKVALIFNKLSSYKSVTYDSFIKEIGERATVDLYVYNYNFKAFEQIILSHLNTYDYYVIVPHFHPGTVGVDKLIRKLPKEKVLIIDKMINVLFEEYPCVYQDFENDIIEALESVDDRLKKYNKLNLIYPASRFFSKEILDGFSRFCLTKNYLFSVIDKIEETQISKGDSFVIISDEDLVKVIKFCRKNKLAIGKDIGILSYNENSTKEILDGGITTISTNHEKIGEQAAKMIITKKWDHVKIPFNINLRESL